MRRQFFPSRVVLAGLLLVLFIGWTNQGGKSRDRTADPPAAFAEDVHPLLIGARVPELTLRAADGSSFNLNAAIANKPTVLIFYRGGW